MILEGDHTFAAPRERVWELLLDPEVIAATMPGASAMTRTGDNRYEGRLKVGIGSITAAEFELVVELTDVVEPERYTMLIDSKGRFGFTRGKALVELSPDGASTRMSYRADIQVGGKIAAVGQRLLDSVSRLMTRQGLEALGREVERRLGGTGA